MFVRLNAIVAVVFILFLTAGECQQNGPTNNGGGRGTSSISSQHQTLSNGQKFFVIQRDTNVLDGASSASSVQFNGMGGGGNPPMGQQQKQFSQNFAASSPPASWSQSFDSSNQQGFMALQQPQTFVPTQQQQNSRMPMQNQQQPSLNNRGMATSQFVQRQSPSGTNLPPMLAPPQLGGAQNAQESDLVSPSADEVACPQPLWKEAIEKAIIPNKANESTNRVQMALSRAARGTFIVACAPADRREAFQKKMRLSASGDNFCHVLKDNVWCQAVAMNLSSGKGISIGMGRR